MTDGYLRGVVRQYRVVFNKSDIFLILIQSKIFIE